MEEKNSNDDNEEQNRCDICDEVPDNFITLQCEHDICIMCTARNLIQDDEKEGTADEFQIRCPKCESFTPIEEETVSNIIQLMDDNQEDEESELQNEEEEDGEQQEGTNSDVELEQQAHQNDDLINCEENLLDTEEQLCDLQYSQTKQTNESQIEHESNHEELNSFKNRNPQKNNHVEEKIVALKDFNSNQQKQLTQADEQLLEDMSQLQEEETTLQDEDEDVQMEFHHNQQENHFNNLPNNVFKKKQTYDKPSRDNENTHTSKNQQIIRNKQISNAGNKKSHKQRNNYQNQNYEQPSRDYQKLNDYKVSNPQNNKKQSIPKRFYKHKQPKKTQFQAKQQPRNLSQRSESSKVYALSNEDIYLCLQYMKSNSNQTHNPKVKKTFPLLKKELRQKKLELSSQMETLKFDEQKALFQKEEVENYYQSIISQVHKDFENIRQILNQKENQIRQKILDQQEIQVMNIQNNLNELQNYEQEGNFYMQELVQTIDNANPLDFFQYLIGNDNSLNEFIENMRQRKNLTFKDFPRITQEPNDRSINIILQQITNLEKKFQLLEKEERLSEISNCQMQKENSNFQRPPLSIKDLYFKENMLSKYYLKHSKPPQKQPHSFRSQKSVLTESHKYSQNLDEYGYPISQKSYTSQDKGDNHSKFSRTFYIQAQKSARKFQSNFQKFQQSLTNQFSSRKNPQKRQSGSNKRRERRWHQPSSDIKTLETYKNIFNRNNR